MWRRREGAQEIEKEAQASCHGDISVDRWLFLVLCSLLLTEHTYTAGKQRLMIIVYEIQSCFFFTLWHVQSIHHAEWLRPGAVNVVGISPDVHLDITVVTKGLTP